MKKQLLAFKREEHCFLIEKTCVQRVGKKPLVHTLPISSQLTCGVVAISGEVLAHFDFATAKNPGSYSVVITLFDSIWAFSVDTLLGFFEIEIPKITYTKASFPFVTHIIEQDEIPFLLIDQKKLHDMLLQQGASYGEK